MTYQRKTQDEYHLMGNYGYGLELLCVCETYKEARQDKKSYLENDRNVFNLKIVKKRVPITNEA